MMIKVFTTDKKDQITLTTKELKELLDEAYWEGYRANNKTYTYTTPKGEWAATTLPKLGWVAKVRGKVGKDLAFPTLEGLLND